MTEGAANASRARTHFDVLEGHDFVAPDARADESAPMRCVRCGKHRADHAECEMRS